MLLTGIAIFALFADLETRAPLIGARYGHIIIDGNTDTPDRVILNLIDARPGHLILPGDVARYRAKVRASGAFWANPWRNEGPDVELVPNDFEGYCDLRISIVERPENWIVFGVLETVWAVKGNDTEGVLGELWRLALRAKDKAAGR